MTSKVQDVRRDLAETLASGYRESRIGSTRRDRDEKLAAGFTSNPTMERLLDLRRGDPAAGAVASRGQTTALALYENAKAAAERLRGDSDVS